MNMVQSSMTPDLSTKNDANTLIDLIDFEYLINQAACDDSNLNSDKPANVLILIHSAARNWHKRKVIRETWGQPDSRARIFFLLGAVKSSYKQKQLKDENDAFHDIIQGNFFDAYRNMTYKHTMALKWFVYNCPTLKYLIKTDDDVFINTPALYKWLHTGLNDVRNLLFCYKVEEARVKRTYRSKWRVSTKEFASRYYPPYCPGFSIIYSNDVVHRLYQEAQQTPYFWIDDVHITGTLAQHANVSITTFSHYYMNEKMLIDLVDGKISLSEMDPVFLFTEPNLKEIQIRDLWRIVNKQPIEFDRLDTKE